MSKITYQDKVGSNGTDQGRCLPDNWNEVKESVNALYDQVNGADQSKTFSGNIKLDSLSGKYDFSSVRTTITIDPSYIVGGWARFLINAPSQPSINLNGELLNVRDEGGWVDNVDLVCTMTVDGPYTNGYNTVTVSFREVQSLQLVLPPPGQVQNFAVDSFTDTTVELSWDTEANSDDYIIQRATDSGFSQNLVTLDSNLAATTYSDSGLTAETTYHYRVAGQNSSGAGPYATTSVTTAATPSASVHYVLLSPGAAAGNTDTINILTDSNGPISLNDINNVSVPNITAEITGSWDVGSPGENVGDPTSTGFEDTTELGDIKLFDVGGSPTRGGSMVISNMLDGTTVNIKLWSKDAPVTSGGSQANGGTYAQVTAGIGAPGAQVDLNDRDSDDTNWTDMGTWEEDAGTIEVDIKAPDPDNAYWSAALLTITLP